MKILNLIALFGTLTQGHGQVISNTPNPQAPVQTRFSKKFLERVFHLHDQEILDTFKNTIIDLSADMNIKGDLTFSFRPIDGIKKEEFDFNLLIETQTLRAKSGQIIVYGEV